jgi:hypothetical protein
MPMVALSSREKCAESRSGDHVPDRIWIELGRVLAGLLEVERRARHAHDDRGSPHPALAAHRTAREVNAGESTDQDDDRFRRCVLGRWLTEQGPPASEFGDPAPRHRASTCAIGEQAEVADTHEAARYDMQEKASQEFVDVERQDLPAIVVRVVLPTESDTAVVVIDEAIIRQRHAVGVSTQVVEHLLGTDSRTSATRVAGSGRFGFV